MSAPVDAHCLVVSWAHGRREPLGLSLAKRILAGEIQRNVAIGAAVTQLQEARLAADEAEEALRQLGAPVPR